MSAIFLLLLSVLMLGLVSHFLGKEILSKRHILGIETGFSRRALRMERSYKLFVLTLLFSVFLFALVQNMILLLMTDPF